MLLSLTKPSDFCLYMEYMKLDGAQPHVVIKISASMSETEATFLALFLFWNFIAIPLEY